MYQTVYPELGTRERHPRAEASHSADAFPPRESSGKRRAHRAPPPGGRVDGVYEVLLRRPVPVMLAALWLSGMALLVWGVLMLYALGASLAAVVGGA